MMCLEIDFSETKLQAEVDVEAEVAVRYGW
jgi:hypothetical protein